MVRSAVGEFLKQMEHARCTPAELRGSLDVLLEAEQFGTKLHHGLRGLLGHQRFRAIFADATLPLTYGEVSEFARELSDDYLASVRESRLKIISFIAANARDHGLNVIDVTDDFRQMFLTAPIEETEGWQETAYLLADVEDAKLLDQSIKSAVRDRTDDIVAAK